MKKSLIELMNELSNSISDENFTDIAYDITDEIEGMPDAFDAVEPILKLMESNPDADFGKPGPLVHFVETFYKKGYEEKLVESLQRRPIMHTVWMLNRIINGSEGDKKEYFLSVLKNISKVPNLDSEVVALAEQFLTLHQ